MPNRKKCLFLIFVLPFFLNFLSGCASMLGECPGPLYIFALKKNVPGVYHRVKKGQTLWRISKTYGVSLDEIVRSNRMSDAHRIKAGERIFIPEVASIKEVPIYQLLTETPTSTKKTDVSVKQAEEISDLAKGDFIWPVKGRVSSYYGQRKGGFHYGIDISARRGREVAASRKGVVSFSGVMRGYGNIIIIDHQDGFSTVYAHNQANLVKENQAIEQGETIAKTGSTGRAKGSHLHFEIRKGVKTINPLFYLP